MSKKRVSQKNRRLSNIAILVAIIAICLILLSSNIVRVVLVVAGAIFIMRTIYKRIDNVKKS